MRLAWVLVCLSFAKSIGAQTTPAQRAAARQAPESLAEQAWAMEVRGEATQAEALLRQAAAGTNASADSLRAYAEFLDRYRDPGARAAYERLAQALDRLRAPAGERAAVYRRLAALDLTAGDREAAARHVAAYAAAGGTGLALSQPKAASSAEEPYIEIPGPLRSFARMAALSPDLKPDDLLPALARNVVTNGYQATSASEGLEQTEYLKLTIRYLSQARELAKLSGEDKTLRIETCDSAATGDLLRVLGYRIRGGCGSDLALETVNASRAFLTIDSGFPLEQLEEALRTNRPFTLDYHPSRIPLLYSLDYWQPAKERTQGEFIDYFLADPSLCRLYLALSKLDPDTSEELRRQIPAARLKIYAHVLDFFGGMFQIRDGKAIVPGGARAEKAWAELAGIEADKGAAFFERLISRDDGWLASYFDALARMNGGVKDYLTDPERLKRFYAAIRGKVTSPGPARPVFRSNTDMLLLTTRLRVDPDGRPHLPGGIEVWKNLFANHPRGKYDAKLTRSAPAWKDGDDVLEALFGLARKLAENEPLKIFMALTDVDRSRATPLQPATVERLARDYREMNAQYALFSEAPSLTDKTILQFLDTAHAISGIHDPALRADVAGTMQALVGLWQILLRQGSIAQSDSDSTLADLLGPFAKIQNEREAFDSGMAGVRLLLKATHSEPGVSPQDRMIDLLAGTAANNSSDTHQQMIEDMIRIFEAQRLVSLSTLSDLADNLDSVARGQKLNTALAGRLASRISEVQLPRTSITGEEKSALSFGYWTERHIDFQRKINLRAIIDKSANDPQKLKDLRGQLAPFLRDTLVGLNYVHYAPPGAQVLRTNPLFVRSHDFIGIPGSEQTWKRTEVFGSGWPANAGGRLVGSLATLPYALGEAEQNFLIPSKEQALIWGDLVPQMLLTGVIPRWWGVSPVQIHWVGTSMAYAEALIAESALNSRRRAEVESVLDRYAAPARVKKLDAMLERADIRSALDNVVPAEMYLLANELAPNDRESALAGSLRRMRAENPEAVSAQTISRTFGSPKPTLANSFQPELLSLRTFPTLMGYSSRILAESWESNLLYYAALADEIHAAPAQLNLLVPEWTQQTVERIFATNLEDWPALLRSLRTLGDEVRGKAQKAAQTAN
ncbi:MAG TPA: hypothetical protein VKV74_10195 [Bryobacteraceae bacterium]|nr:hypothetical protein [Bryobacteraceae bacterium]